MSASRPSDWWSEHSTTNAEFADELGYSLSTIRHASMAICRKLSVTGRSEAVVRAYALRLISPGSDW